MAFQHLVEACPLERILAIAPRQPFLPYPHLDFGAFCWA
jgi:hypothetical protein